ncbi:MAG: glycosyltransferase family 1 protein [Planctomycetota bacterium]
MHIGFQLLSLKPGHIGGQEVYVRRLIRCLLPMLADDRLILFLRPEAADDEEFRQFADHTGVETVVANPEPHYGPQYADWNLRLLDAARLDVVCFPLSFFFPRPLPIPVVLHVPDLQHEFFPEYFPPEQLAWRRERIPASINLAEATVTYTQFSARTMVEKLDADEKRLHVISAGGFSPQDLETAAVQDGFGPHDQPFAFYPAADWPHKNHETLLHAIAKLKQRGDDLRLVLCGMLTQRGEALKCLANDLNINDRVSFLGRLLQSELIGLYKFARVMAFPSRFEGFGLPLVEAMQLGCPIVASRAEAVRETASDAALYCDDQPEAWAAALSQVAGDPQVADDLRHRGLQRAADFNWPTAAQKNLALLRNTARTRSTT